VAAQRARFEEKQRQLQQDLAEADHAVREVQQKVEEQYQQAIQDPEHQAFVSEQLAHDETDPPHIRGGKERDGQPELLSATPSNVEIGAARAATDNTTAR
jgi:hypothetical protein